MTTAPSALAADPGCPDAAPVSDAVPGLAVHGLTVSAGTTPDAFTGSVLGVLKDGIAPGVDMITAELDSPELERVGGIWAGMSGSPVYTEDGRLLGAVSYGLSFGPSRVAGITPAAQMYDVLARTSSSSATTTTKVALTPSMKSQAVSSGAATSGEADSGMQRLPLPLAISGLTPARRSDNRVMSRLASNGTRPYAAASAPAATSSDPAEDIVPGGNLAAGLSYGDLSAVAVGTATAVCNGNVVAFGHPFEFSGATTESLHGADALFVQDDPTFGPFKVANPSAPVGTITQDRLTGIAGAVGPTPETIPVTTHVASEGRSRDGRTDVVEKDLLPDLAAFHLLSNMDVIDDRIGGGVALLHTTITGTRGDGTPWTFDRTDRSGDPYDVSFGTVFPLYDQVYELQNTSLDQVSVTGVHVDAEVDQAYTDYSISSVEVRAPDGRWMTSDGDSAVKAVTGDRLRVRVHLHGYQNTGDRTERLVFVVPPGNAGNFGQLDVSGGFYGGDEFGGDFAGTSNGPATFDDLVSDMETAPRGDDVVGTFRIGSRTKAGPPPTVEKRARADRLVTGGIQIPVRIVAPRSAKPGYVSNRVWSLRDRLSAGTPTTTFRFGASGARPLMGDWDGDGVATPATFADGTWTIRPSALSTDTLTVSFGAAGDRPVVGDWNGDGTDDLGVLHGHTFLLRHDLSPASAVATVDLPDGVHGQPVAGDWNGDGIDTVGVESQGTWTLLKHNTTGSDVITATFAVTRGRAVVGDWDRDGRDSIGMYRGRTWSLRNRLLAGRATIVFRYGVSGAAPVVWT